MKTKEEALKPIIDFIGEAPEAVDFLQDKVCSMCGQPFNKSRQVKELLELVKKALDEYADWKIMECLPEKRNFEHKNQDKNIKARLCQWFDNGFNHCVDQILLNKDKK